jgi:hypothetical protein
MIAFENVNIKTAEHEDPEAAVNELLEEADNRKQDGWQWEAEGGRAIVLTLHVKGDRFHATGKMRRKVEAA